MIRNVGAIVMVAVRYDRIAIVRASPNEIDLVTATRAHLRAPELAGGVVEFETLGAAVPIRLGRFQCAGDIDKRVVGRYPPVVLNAVNLAIGKAQVLDTHVFV